MCELLVLWGHCDHTFETGICSHVPHPVCTAEQCKCTHWCAVLSKLLSSEQSLPQEPACWLALGWAPSCRSKIPRKESPIFKKWQGTTAGRCQCFSWRCLIDCYARLMMGLASLSPLITPSLQQVPRISFTPFCYQVVPGRNNRKWRKMLRKHKDLGWRI